MKNRFIFLPHLTGYAIDEGWMDCGLFSERNIQHYVERAKEERQQCSESEC